MASLNLTAPDQNSRTSPDNVVLLLHPSFLLTCPGCLCPLTQAQYLLLSGWQGPMLESYGVKDIFQPLHLKLEQACEPCPAPEGEAVSLSLGI